MEDLCEPVSVLLVGAPKLPVPTSSRYLSVTPEETAASIPCIKVAQSNLERARVIGATTSEGKFHLETPPSAPVASGVDLEPETLRNLRK